MSENGLLDPGIASAIERTKGVKQGKQEGVRAGNWLLKEQANELLNAPDCDFERQARPRHLALLISCGPRRAELVGLVVDRIQQRDCGN